MHNHAVEELPVVGLGNPRRSLHRARSQANFPTNQLLPGRDLQRHPGPLNRIGIRDVHVWKFPRHMADLALIALCMIKLLRDGFRLCL